MCASGSCTRQLLSRFRRVCNEFRTLGFPSHVPVNGHRLLPSNGPRLLVQETLTPNRITLVESVRQLPSNEGAMPLPLNGIQNFAGSAPTAPGGATSVGSLFGRTTGRFPGQQVHCHRFRFWFGLSFSGHQSAAQRSLTIPDICENRFHVKVEACREFLSFASDIRDDLVFPHRIILPLLPLHPFGRKQ
jgi:hypothetical protein